ncbi:MAG: PKD domain-containing protein, partial [Bdellovibrionota bacterium]
MNQVARYLLTALLVTGCGNKAADDVAKVELASSNMNMSLAAKAYAELNGPQIVVIGDTATFSVVGATGQTITNADWNMGDGSNRASILTGTVTHTYTSLGRFTVTAMVFDDTGNGTLLSQV